MLRAVCSIFNEKKAEEVKENDKIEQAQRMYNAQMQFFVENVAEHTKHVDDISAECAKVTNTDVFKP